jgi:hypothetical protein
VAALGVVALLIVLGVEPWFSAVTALPGFRTAHNGRMVIFVLFALALLAGWGLDDLTRPDAPPRRRRRLVLALSVVVFLVPFVALPAVGAIDLGRFGEALGVAWGFEDPPPPPAGAARDADVLRAAGGPVPQSTYDVIRLSALLQWFVLAGAGLALVLLRMRGWRGPRLALPAAAFAALAVLVLAGDLFRANMGFNPAIPVEHAEQPRTGGLEYLEGRAPNRFAGFNRPGIGQPLQPNLAMRYELFDARGYDYPVIKRYDDFWRATAAPPGEFIPPTSRAEPTVRSLRALSLLSVTDIMQDPHDPPLDLPGLRIAYDRPDARIYRNARALPRALLVGGQRVVSNDDESLAATTAPGFDPRRVAIVEEAVPGLRRAPQPAAGTARLDSYEDERVVVEADASAPALLVLTDVYYPGWKASVDGAEAEVDVVDHLLRGVRVPPGRHTVELTYEPLSWRIGWIVSVLALMGVTAAAAVGWRRRGRDY